MYLSRCQLLTIQLPIQRQYIRVQLETISILLDLMKIYARHMFQERLRRKTTHATCLVSSQTMDTGKIHVLN
jgi:hypothetical protein